MGRLQERYEEYLRRERGLAEATIRYYAAFIRTFLHKYSAGADVAPWALDPRCVRGFLLDRVNARPTRSAKTLATVLRSFLRFLFCSGETAVDLSRGILMVRRWRLATVHPFLTVQEVEQVLQSCDLTTPIGRRDHAVLLLLARLGLRAGEVVALYIRGDRGPSVFRQVFLRALAPRIPFKTHAAVGSLTRSALERAGLHPAQHGAHIFRYSLGTAMIRQGAIMAEISQVLRHRSSDTTEIYAKVDFPSLRGVARPWPSTGGEE